MSNKTELLNKLKKYVKENKREVEEGIEEIKNCQHKIKMGPRKGQFCGNTCLSNKTNCKKHNSCCLERQEYFDDFLEWAEDPKINIYDLPDNLQFCLYRGFVSMVRKILFIKNELPYKFKKLQESFIINEETNKEVWYKTKDNKWRIDYNYSTRIYYNLEDMIRLMERSEYYSTSHLQSI